MKLRETSKVMEKAYEITPGDGQRRFVGVPDNKISIYSLPLAFNKILKVSHGGDPEPDQENSRYVESC